MYQDTKEFIKLRFKDIKSIALTTDGWTSILGSPYISLTVHAINNDFVLIFFLLGTVHAPSNHTGDYLFQKLEGNKWAVS